MYLGGWPLMNVDKRVHFKSVKKVIMACFLPFHYLFIYSLFSGVVEWPSRQVCEEVR